MNDDISKKTLIIVDHGLYTAVAQDMAKYWGKVLYWNPVAEPYSHSPKAFIGEGLPGVQRITSLWKHIDKADCLFFPDVYHGQLQHFLRSKGYLVCGSGRSEILELDKSFFKSVLDKVKLPQAKTYRAEGLDDVWQYLKDRKPGNYFMKNAEQHRGDWETSRFYNKHHLELLINKKKHDLGVSRASSIEILIEEKINSGCEGGADGFMLDGVMADNSMSGYEVKDQGYIGKVFKKLPPIVQGINDKLAPVFKKIGGYAGPYSTELRITPSKKAYVIDLTCRCPSPPTGVELEIYGQSYGQAVWELSNGRMPNLKTTAKYGAELILQSTWYENGDLHVGFDKSIENQLKLKNAIKKNGQFYCIPNDNEGVFGSMVGTGNTIKQAIRNCLDAVECLDVAELEWRHDVFDEAMETIKNGEEYGIDFS